jgi:hypothetical protein
MYEGSFGNVYAIQFSADEFFCGNERDALLHVSAVTAAVERERNLLVVRYFARTIAITKAFPSGSQIK